MPRQPSYRILALMASRNGALKTSACVVGIVAAIVAVLFQLGVLPWATQAEVTGIKKDVGKRLERIEGQVDAIHRVFYPPHRSPVP